MSQFDTNSTRGNLIAASKVDGTAVYDPKGGKIGSIHDVMLDKISGKADYAVMSFGGFLGIGEKYHPLPWGQLRYDTSLEGYVINLDRAQLEGAPIYNDDELSVFDERHRSDIDAYYQPGLDPGAVANPEIAAPRLSR